MFSQAIRSLLGRWGGGNWFKDPRCEDRYTKGGKYNRRVDIQGVGIQGAKCNRRVDIQGVGILGVGIQGAKCNRRVYI